MNLTDERMPQSSLGFCTHGCDSGCAGTQTVDGVCGVAPDGSRACFPPCEVGTTVYACDANGVPTACAQLDDSYCAVCGCPSTLRCQAGVGCVPKADVGAACETDDDCKTLSCSPYASVCRVPPGSPCTSTDCDFCVCDPSGFSFCDAPGCSADGCGSNGICLQDVVFGGTYCELRCTGTNDPSCPGTCDYTADPAMLYCKCSSCSQTIAKRALGRLCESDDECTSNQCYGPGSCSGVPRGTSCGWCSATCSSTADCGAGLECVEIPCTVPDSSCTPKCLPTCANGTCQVGVCSSMQSVAGSVVQACDVRAAGLASCSGAAQCLSGACANGACSPPGGLPNGSSCQMATDCRSGSCEVGVCKGQALVGDPCSVDADCAVGQCCTSGPNAGKCASGC
jgi:hypothetical protein